jgi:hypothetical protein
MEYSHEHGPICTRPQHVSVLVMEKCGGGRGYLRKNSPRHSGASEPVWTIYSPPPPDHKKKKLAPDENRNTFTRSDEHFKKQSCTGILM